MIKMTIINQDKIDISLNMTMNLKEWKGFANQLANKWPASDLLRVINELIWKIDTEYRATEDTND